ncbi:FAD-binding oxidoreductase [Salinisphaera sp. T31B1]|uniref:NAD(P)/FAD-dependent oxidoreductase n=1 Tax=Salinisphaera sp. T31B1 TaxID=727963 RepID=UPI0033416E03
MSSIHGRSIDDVQHTTVLGAGMVGVSIAYHLALRGQRVTLVDRRAPGRETSFGNAGLIQREAVMPHPFPRDLANMWRVLPNRSIDIRYRAGAMFAAAEPLLEYWRSSAPARFAEIVPEYASLIVHCTAEHERMFTAAGAESLIRRDGWFEVFRTSSVFEQAQARAADIHTRFGVEYAVLDQTALAEAEPYLGQALIGAIHWTNSWSVSDPGALVQAYATAFEALGGQFVQAQANDIDNEAGHWRLHTDQGTIDSDAVVLATGPWSNQWLERLGYEMPLFHMRGYHMHYSAADGATLDHAFLDHEKGYLLSPKRAGLRLTTGAELNTLEAPPRTGQLEAAEAEVRTIFPLGERREAQPWKGARPCMGDMKPVIGPAPRHDNLWLAFGHGHQGFTLGPITGRLVGEMMAGESPVVDMRPFRAERFDAH